jgi:predicted RND superfamily exporter protein
MTTRTSERVARFCIRQRLPVILVVALITILLLVFALRQDVRTVFADLLPQDHPYIQTHEQFKESFGGSNLVSIMLTVEEGDIFRPEVLGKIRDITRDLREVSGVNQFQIISLASKKLKEVHASTYGIESRPLMWPDVPQQPADLERLRDSVLANPLVYGTYVSTDLKAALITVDFIDRLMEYQKVFRQVNEIAERARGDGVEVKVVGEPILQGLVNRYLPETLIIFLLTIGALGLVLFLVFMRTLRGTLIPLLSAVVTGIWALGIASLLGFNFDPLSIVIAFLITARVISHSVQAVTRFDDYLAAGTETAEAAARASLADLWKPGLLSVVTDAGGIMVVALAPIPLLQKSALIGAVWVLCISVTGVILTPVLLSWIRRPKAKIHHWDLVPWVERSLSFYSGVATDRRRKAVLWGTLALFLISGYFASEITIGDANPGTPLLWPESDYNRAVAEINGRFLGTDRMFVVVGGEREETLQQPEVLSAVARFQRHVELQPEVGGSISLADLIPSVNRVLNEGNPRYQELGQDPLVNGELLYMYLAGSDPGDLDRFTDVNYQTGAVTLFFRDHQGRTIRTAIERIKRFIADNPVEGATFRLAGGLIGVLAAVNEVIFAGQIESIALALLVILVTCSLTYRSGVAGVYFMVPVLLSNTVTFAYMTLKGIGLNINTLPVAALGIGLGVDYSIYVVDSIKENFAKSGDLKQAILRAAQTAGRGVVVTSTPLIACTALWYFFSSLRFQAEMAILIALWMAVSAGSALLLMPAMTYTFKPRFIVGTSHASQD